MAKCLVTGGAGFIGSHLVRRLVKEGHGVRVLDNLSTGDEARIAHLADRVEFMRADVRSAEACRSACRGVDIVYHQAAMPSVPRSIEQPEEFHDHNINGTFQLLMAARDAGCRRCVYAASSSAYGDQPDLPKKETMLPRPLSPYAVHKLTGEYYAAAFYRAYGLETVSLRYFNVFGPQQDPHSDYAAVIPAFITAILRSEQPLIYGDGEQTRDFTYIDNVIEANLLAAAAPHTGGEVLNIGSGARVSVNEVARSISRLVGESVEPRHLEARPGDVKHSLADIGRARELIGYQPGVLFEEGLRRTIAWYREDR